MIEEVRGMRQEKISLVDLELSFCDLVVTVVAVRSLQSNAALSRFAFKSALRFFTITQEKETSPLLMMMRST